MKGLGQDAFWEMGEHLGKREKVAVRTALNAPMPTKTYPVNVTLALAPGNTMEATTLDPYAVQGEKRKGS
jgi:hypothetical protein